MTSFLMVWKMFLGKLNTRKTAIGLSTAWRSWR